jgi:hypothetical protein
LHNQHILHNWIVHNPIIGSRFKRDGVSRKTVPLLGHGFLHLVDHLFWNLPFASVKQGTAVREKFHVSEEDWDTRFQEITSEHDRDGARQELIEGWKSWIKAIKAQEGEGGEGGAATSVDMSLVEVDE